jgi:2-dehydro-3-deoxygluconokinase
MNHVITLGESLVCLTPEQNGPLRHAANFTRRMAGAEGNTAIGLARLGIPARWLGRVGDDEFGRFLTTALRGEGVETFAIQAAPGLPTAIYFKEFRGWGETSVYYYRRNSAGSTLTPEDLSDAWWTGATWLHLTGITPMLSDSCAATVEAAVREAKHRNIRLSVDPNIRRRLGTDDELRRRIRPLVEAADLILLNDTEAEFLYNQNPVALCESLARAVPGRMVVLKQGAQGAAYWSGDQHLQANGITVQPGRDPIGAGDGFNAGFLAGLIRGLDISTALRLGCFGGGLAVTVDGDYEGYPTWAEAERFLASQPPVTR